MDCFPRIPLDKPQGDFHGLSGNSCSAAWVLLRSQLTEEEIKEARDTGFIVNEHLLHTKQAFETQLSGYSTSDIYYWAWLLAFPTIPPEQRNPMPYMAGSAALDIRGIGRIGSGDPIYVVAPPELMAYADTTEGV